LKKLCSRFRSRQLNQSIGICNGEILGFGKDKAFVHK
jgi:hypothetical protein